MRIWSSLALIGPASGLRPCVREWKGDRLRARQTADRGTDLPLVFRPGEAFQFDWPVDWPVRLDNAIGPSIGQFDRPVRSANAIGQRGWMLRTGPVSGASASSVPRGPHEPSAQPRGSDQGLLAADTCDAVRCTLARIRSGHPRTGGGLPLTFEGVLGRGIHDTAAWPPSVRGLAGRSWRLIAAAWAKGAMSMRASHR